MCTCVLCLPGVGGPTAPALYNLDSLVFSSLNNIQRPVGISTYSAESSSEQLTDLILENKDGTAEVSGYINITFDTGEEQEIRIDC